MVRDELPVDLQEYERELAGVLHEGLERYMRDFGTVRATTSTLRSERNNIHDCIIATAKSKFPYTLKNNRFVVYLGRYIARWKKFNERLETANFPTQSCLAFEQQLEHEQPSIPGLEPINVDVGYVPNQIDPRLSTFWIRQPGPGAWVYQLRLASRSIPTPLPITDPNVERTTRRANPKSAPKTTKKSAGKKE